MTLPENRPFFGPDAETSKAVLFKLIGYTIASDPRSPSSAETVRKFHRSTAVEIFVTAPARGSKSWSAAPEMSHDFFPRLDNEASDFTKPGGSGFVPIEIDADLHIWVVPPVYKLAKEWKYAREHLIDRGLVRAFGGKIETNTDAESQGNMQLTVLWPWKTKSGRPCRTPEMRTRRTSKSRGVPEIFSALCWASLVTNARACLSWAKPMPTSMASWLFTDSG